MATFTSDDKESAIPLDNERIERIVSLSHLLKVEDNQFIRFPLYMMISTDVAKLSLKHAGYQPFVSEEITDYSINGIKNWRVHQIDLLVAFYKKLNISAIGCGPNIYSSIQEAIDFLEKRDWLDNFDEIRFQEMLYFQAVFDGKVDVIKEIFKQNYQLDKETKIYGYNAIWMAFERVHKGESYEALQYLIKVLKVNPYILDKNNFTIMCYAVSENLTKIVTLLIEDGVSVEANGCIRSPLYLAAETGNLEIAKLLLAEGASVNTRFSKDNHYVTTLMTAVESKNLSMVELLLAYGGDANDKYGDIELWKLCGDPKKDDVCNLIKTELEQSRNIHVNYRAVYEDKYGSLPNFCEVRTGECFAFNSTIDFIGKAHE